MKYKLNHVAGSHFCVLLDADVFDHKKMVELADALDTDANLDCFEYTTSRNLQIHRVHVRVINTQIERDSQPGYIIAICNRVLGTNE